MINTYQTSLAPPPVPPRLNRSHPVLIPAPAPSRSYSKSLIRFLVGVVLMHLVLSVIGFIYLYSNGRILENFQAAGRQGAPQKGAYLSPEQQKTSNRVLARMVTQRHHTQPKSKPGYVQWDVKYSQYSHKDINHYLESWLTILKSGDYYVYSRVTFSRNNSTRPLANRIKFKKNKDEKTDKTIMQAFCHLDRESSVPSLCSATQGDVIKLEKGNQLGVWVEDLSLVDYSEGATTFGLYSL